ncbi:IS110 family transposase [Tetragenococcus halophilus subsp. flandriensis]|nr:IS110 family transposase [Tetragenococcus halophilus subsp. flandriensis]
MRIVYPVCCGIDVHKSFLVATIITTKSSGLTPHYQKKRFSTFNNQILALKDWLLENHCYDVCMESTGKYWVPVSNLLEDVIDVTIANPKWVRAVKGNKDDTKDSKWIAELFRVGLVKGSFVPAKDIRVLREFTRYRTRLVSQRSSEKNRLQNAFTVGNVAMDSVVSDMFGVSSKKIRDYLISTHDFDPEKVISLLHGKMKPKSQELIASIEGYRFTDEQILRIQIIEEHKTYLDHAIQFIDYLIDQMIVPYEPAVQLLETIPGIGRQSAVQVISEIGVDMSQFPNPKKLCCWAGLSPASNETGGKKKSVRIARAGVYLKPTLVQCAHAAVKASEKNAYYRTKYKRIYKRREKKRAIIAIARMILTAIYHMLSTGEVWNPTDLYKIDMPNNLVQKQKEKAIKQATKLLIKEGLLPEDFVKK